MPPNSQSMPPNLLDPRIESLPPAAPPNPAFDNRLDGVIILVSAGDVYLAKACCASVRQSMGNIPITLLVDGPNTDTSEVQRLPNVHRMVVQEIVDEEYAPLCSSFWVKLLVHWKSPYERFLYLDADTIVWGDLREYARFDEYDFIAAYRFTSPIILRFPEEIQAGAFDIETIKRFDPTFDWKTREAANAGAFFARRGAFSREYLITLRRLDCWRCYENGMLHYFMWRALQNGTPRIGGYRMQLFPASPVIKPEDRFLPREGRAPAIIHWITQKPRLGRRFKAADDYRKLFLKMTGRTSWLGLRLWLEDIGVWLGRQRRSLGKRLGSA